MAVELSSKFSLQLEDWLGKRGHFFRNWRNRLFVLNMRDKTLKYYSSKFTYEEEHSDPKGEYLLSELSTFEILPEQEGFKCKCAFVYDSKIVCLISFYFCRGLFRDCYA
jgi:hypothetical protein